ncbi:MAG: PEP-CTERM sorting domain-containing protein [Candidatus Nealsonbacteria bacterium]|nr:PEP-CTERM sorting domain-containing protein [Candidatus Nealsonbacteria bacterium]
MRCFLSGLVLVVLSFNGLTQARAEKLIGNLPITGGGAALISSDSQFAQGFAIPPGNSYALESVKFHLRSVWNPPALAVANLRADGGSSGERPIPGPIIATLDCLTVPDTSKKEYLYVPTSPIVLEADTTYWVEVAPDPAGGWVGWNQGDPPTAPTGIASYVGLARSSDGGVSWHGTSLPFGTYGFEVNATTVPEPSTLAMLGAGALGLVVFARRRRGKRPSV